MTQYMEPNEIPDKIILSADRETGKLYNEWVIKDLTNNIKIEYTRTDAFIEKACKFIKEHHHEFSFWNTEEYELGFSTEKFIEDFKNYMKGE